jgi:hypothetical protein
MRLGWVGLRAGLDGCGKSRPHRDTGIMSIVKYLFQIFEYGFLF